MTSDLVTAVALARAGKEGALANVEINLASIKNQEFVDEVRAKLAEIIRPKEVRLVLHFGFPPPLTAGIQ